MSVIRQRGRGISEMRVFFFNDTATTEIYTLSLHDALPISWYCGEFTGSRKRGDLLDSPS